MNTDPFVTLMATDRPSAVFADVSFTTSAAVKRPGTTWYSSTLRVLADDTGGDVIVDSNNFSGGFQRFVRDNSSYYLLGYVPTVEHRDGKFHDLKVRVNRRNVTVRARRGYYAPEPDAAAAPAPAIVDGLSEGTAAALRMPSSVVDAGVDHGLRHGAPGNHGRGPLMKLQAAGDLLVQVRKVEVAVCVHEAGHADGVVELKGVLRETFKAAADFAAKDDLGYVATGDQQNHIALDLEGDRVNVMANMNGVVHGCGLPPMRQSANGC
jgi:hypothetical protein